MAMWVDKYHPRTFKEFIGNERHVAQLRQWIEAWRAHYNSPLVPVMAPKKGKGKEGNGNAAENEKVKYEHAVKPPEKRAVLLSGPPGIGKTTIAHLALEAHGFAVLEANASDARSEGAFKKYFSEITRSRSIKDALARLEAPKKKEDEKALSSAVEKKDESAVSCPQEQDIEREKPGHGERRVALLLDEIDGMASGVALLTGAAPSRTATTKTDGKKKSVIETTAIPIICTCNDTNAQKIRTLKTHCLHFIFNPPEDRHVTALAWRVILQEKLDIKAGFLHELVHRLRGDVRQLLHKLEFISRGDIRKHCVAPEEEEDATDKSVDPWDYVSALLDNRLDAAAGAGRQATLDERAQGYFSERFMVTALVHENYPRTVRDLEGMLYAADALSRADLVSKHVEGRQRWDLDPHRALLCTVAVAAAVRQQPDGKGIGRLRFPLELGKMSARTKRERLARELRVRVGGVLSARTDIVLHYGPLLRTQFIDPLAQRGAGDVATAAEKVAAWMRSRRLKREDWDDLAEVLWLEDAAQRGVPGIAKKALTAALKPPPAPKKRTKKSPPQQQTTIKGRQQQRNARREPAAKKKNNTIEQALAKTAAAAAASNEKKRPREPEAKTEARAAKKVKTAAAAAAASNEKKRPREAEPETPVPKKKKWDWNSWSVK